MSSIPKRFFIIGVGVFLIVLSIAVFNLNGGELIVGITGVYIGSVLLFYSKKEKSPDFGALKFRRVIVGIMSIILGLIYLVDYLL